VKLPEASGAPADRPRARRRSGRAFQQPQAL